MRGEIFPPFQDLLDASENLGFFRIGAHPCRRKKELWKMGALLKRLDALEINARELPLAGWVRHQAEQLGVGVVAGSDAHHWLQIGRLVNLLPEGFDLTAAGLKAALGQKQLNWQRGGRLPIFRK